MGVYFNPSNESFTSDKNSKIYVDKTGLLEYLNEILGTNSKCVALSHARRFGKSHAAGIHMYNPNSVVQAMENRDFDSYWKNTSSFASINTFITMNYAGLKDDIMTMLAGGKVMVDPKGFQNDLSEIHSKDDALTALIHLGYLGYDADRRGAYIPNYEVAEAFQLALKTGEWTEIAKTISRCDELLMATIDGEADKVAEIIEQAHDTYTSVLKYNDENSLSCVHSKSKCGMETCHGGGAEIQPVRRHSH